MARLLIFGVAVVLVLCFFKPSTSCCCFVPREPCVYQTCGCAETPAGVVSCCGCPDYVPSTTACSTCASCFRDPACPCKKCPEKPSPVCSCLKSLDSSCGCGTCDCEGLRIYYPEVEYPNTILEMNPFYFANCWSF